MRNAISQVTRPTAPHKPFVLPRRGNRLPTWRDSLHAQTPRPITLPVVRWLTRPVPHPEIDALRRARP